MNGVIEMSYYLTIVEQDLKCQKDIAKELKKMFESQELYYFWDYDKSTIRHGEGYFKWTEGFIKDLLLLKEFGARGFITCYGEEGEYYKFEVTDESIKEFYGSVRFPKKATNVFKSEKDLKKPSI
jgi:hypothetical protein